jgi:hypothetical protein
MLPLSSESISQIKVLQLTNAAYLFNVQRTVTQNGDFCDQCVHELFCYFWAGEFTPKRAPTFSETSCIGRGVTLYFNPTTELVKRGLDRQSYKET